MLVSNEAWSSLLVMHTFSQLHYVWESSVGLNAFEIDYSVFNIACPSHIMLCNNPIVGLLWGFGHD